MCCSREMTPEEKIAVAKTPEDELAAWKDAHASVKRQRQEVVRSRDEWKRLAVDLLAMAGLAEKLVDAPWWAVWEWPARLAVKREFRRKRRRFALAELPDGLSVAKWANGQRSEMGQWTA